MNHLRDRINDAARAILDGRTTVLNRSADMAIVRVIGRRGDEYIATVSPAGCTCQCEWGRHTPWGWANPCYHSLAAAGAIDLDVPLVTASTEPDTDMETAST